MQGAGWGVPAGEQEGHSTAFVGNQVRNTCGLSPLPSEWDGSRTGVLFCCLLVTAAHKDTTWAELGAF